MQLEVIGQSVQVPGNSVEEDEHTAKVGGIKFECDNWRKGNGLVQCGDNPFDGGATVLDDGTSLFQTLVLRDGNGAGNASQG
jgi:hypothetical protein